MTSYRACADAYEERMRRYVSRPEMLDVHPSEHEVLNKVAHMRNGYSENERGRLATLVTAESAICVIDRLDRVIELLERITPERTLPHD